MHLPFIFLRISVLFDPLTKASSVKVNRPVTALGILCLWRVDLEIGCTRLPLVFSFEYVYYGQALAAVPHTRTCQTFMTIVSSFVLVRPENVLMAH